MTSSPEPRTPARIETSRRNGSRSRGPFALLPREDADELARLHAAVTVDWDPRDADGRSDSGAVRWVMEPVTAMWRQDRLRGLELAALAAAAGEKPPSEATLRRLTTFAR